jgi:hypothetical protein
VTASFKDSFVVIALYFAGYGSLAIPPIYLLATMKKERRFKKAMIWGFGVQILLTSSVWTAVGFSQNPYLFMFLLPVGLVGLLYYSLLPVFRRIGLKKEERA